MTIYPDDKIEYRQRYQLEVYFPDTTIFSRFYFKAVIGNKLSKLGLEYEWKPEKEQSDYFNYYLSKPADLTHSDIFKIIQEVYNKTMWINCQTVTEEIKPESQSDTDWWEWFGGLFLLPYLIYKREDIKKWWAGNWWKVMISTGIILLLIIWTIGYIKRPTVIIRK